MANLAELCDRIKHQYLEPQQAALPAGAVEEAIRLTLGRINARFREAFRIEGLDAASESNLPMEFEPALLIGTGAAVMRFLLQSHLSSYTNMGGKPELMRALAVYLEERFDWMLEGLRLDGVQAAADLPFSRWEWEERSRWQD